MLGPTAFDLRQDITSCGHAKRMAIRRTGRRKTGPSYPRSLSLLPRWSYASAIACPLADLQPSTSWPISLSMAVALPPPPRTWLVCRFSRSLQAQARAYHLPKRIARLLCVIEPATTSPPPQNCNRQNYTSSLSSHRFQPVNENLSRLETVKVAMAD